VFHPICALVASNAAAWKLHHSRTGLSRTEYVADQRIEQVLRDDEFLCTQFRIAKVEVGSSATGEKTTLPVAYCGYHNPDRRADMYGLYPGGEFLAEGAMRIPPIPGIVDAGIDA
jgi:hypothetical protein